MAGNGDSGDPQPVIIATTFREAGTTGVHTHFQQVAQFLRQHGTSVRIVTPFSWVRALGPQIRSFLLDPVAVT